jgi:PAS domain S-box-containing protein
MLEAVCGEGSKAVKQAKAIGKYVLHPAPLRLTEGRRTVSLTPRELDVLAMLLEANGEIVSKVVFMETIWHGSFVDPGNLTQTIYLIRKAMGKLPGGGEFIETVPKQGYRIAAIALAAASSLTGPINASPAEIFEKGSSPSEEHFRLLVESVEDYAIYMLDCAGRIMTWNPGIENNYGYTAGEILGHHYSVFFASEDIKAHVPDRELAKALKHGRNGGEGWRIRKNGERFWVSFVFSAMRGPTGKLLGFATVVRDLTERKKQEDAMLRMEALLRRERDRLSAAAESSMDAFFICEAVRTPEGEIEDFIFTYLNTNVEKMVSIPREVLLRGKMCELLPINRTLGLFEEYKRVVLTGKPYVAEFPVRAENVTSEWVRVQAVRLEDGVAITASDITDRRKAARGLQAAVPGV